MSRPAWLAPAAAAGAVAVLVAVGAVVPAPAGVTEPPPVRTEPLTGAQLVCPDATEVPGASTVAAGVALPGIDGAAAPTGSLSLLPLAEEPGAALAESDERGVTISAPTADGPLVLAATGALAPATVGEVSTTAAGDRTSGLAALTCADPGRDWWFLAGDGGVGRRTTLVLGNVADGPAVVDVEVWTEDGLLRAAGTDDLGIPARGTRTVSIDAVAAGSERLAVHVAASVGKVGAALVVREVDGADPVGLTWVMPSEPPSTLSYVPGVPAFGARTLRVANPGEQDAIVSLRAVSGQGPFTPVGLEAIDVPALSVVDVDLSAAGEEYLSLEVSSTQPVVSAVRATQTPASGLGDFAVMGSAPTLDGVAATRVSTADGRSSRLVLTALPESGAGPVRPSAAATPLPSPTESPSASPAASPTGSPEASPEASPPASPTESPAASPTGSPDSSDEEESFIDVETPTTSAAVRLLGLDGVVLDEQTATLALGTTDPFPVTLPEGVEEAWLVVVPAEPGRVLAARETTTTVQVPDALDPDATRDAFWLDILTLRSARTTVAIPPVLPDLTVAVPARAVQPGSE